MKKEWNNKLEVYKSKNFEELPLKRKLPYPFVQELLCLLKKENKFPQEYYYIQQGEEYAFFVLYENKMNIFTFGNLKCHIPLQVIGYPCSLSNEGYVTNNEKMMMEYIKTIKGAKLVLNVPNPIEAENMTMGQTLPTCIFFNGFHTMEEYMNSLRSPYRRRIRKAIQSCSNLVVREGDRETDVYQLYLNTYYKSEYKLEKLERDFFKKVDATKIVFFREKKPVGFVLLKEHNQRLIFMLCGMDYTEATADLYYYMLYHVIAYGIQSNCKSIDLGQTSEETKMKFGAVLEKRYFYAHHSNKLLNYIVKKGVGLLEYTYQFPEYRVFRDSCSNKK